MPVDPIKDLRGWCDKSTASEYVGLSTWQFDRLVRQHVFQAATYLTPTGKGMWSYAGLDAS
jgi:hypothetical protein